MDFWRFWAVTRLYNVRKVSPSK